LLVLHAQPYNPAKVNKKAQQYFSTGMTNAEDGKFTEAISLLEMAIYTDPGYVDSKSTLASF